MKLATAAQMRELDRTAIERYHIPGMILMENAGRGTVDFMVRELGPIRSKSVPIFIGPGNNGGDGLVIARTIHQLGGLPFLFYLVHPEKIRGDAAANQRIVEKLPLDSLILSESPGPEIERVIKNLRSEHPIHSMVDAIFGTGLTRELTGRFREAVDTANRLSDALGIPLVAVDIPSGLDTDSGVVLGTAIHASLTATYGLAKAAHFHHGGEHIGKLSVVDIGIPPKLTAQPEIMGESLDGESAALLRPRKTASHKGGCGHLLIVAGSPGKTGAAILSGLGALHGGAGLVSLAVPGPLNQIIETELIEAMTIPLPGSAPFVGMGFDDYDLITENLAKKKALVIGPGIGTEEATIQLVLRLYREVKIPMIIDADALNALAYHSELLPEAAGPRILTPHPGEMGRLLGISNKEVQADRIGAAAKLARVAASDTSVVLKGAGTLCSHSSGQWVINTSGNSGMAAGGMGDVLSGLIGALVAQGYSPWESAKIGVFLHGSAADLIAEKYPWGYPASHVAAALPLALSQLLTNKTTN